MGLQETLLVNFDKEEAQTIPNRPFPGAADFEPFRLYTKNTLIVYEGSLYRARYNFTAGEFFTITDWEFIASDSTKWGTIAGKLSDQEDLQNEFDATNSNLADLQNKVTALEGIGGYLTAYDFGTSTPLQQDITNQALAQISTITDPVQIWNGTRIINLFDNHLWILTNTQDTEPPVFEWTDQGVSMIKPFDVDIGGYIVGADPAVDGSEYVYAQPDGKGKIDLDGLKQILFDMEHPIGDGYVQWPGCDDPNTKYSRGNWVKWNYRVSWYWLSATPPTTQFIDDWKQYRNDIWRLNTDGTVAKQGTKAYTKPVDFVCVPRKIIHNNVWDDADLEEGHQIQGGDYDEMYIWMAQSIAGAFPSFEDEEYEGGGFRPPFEEGVMGDMARNITGKGGGVFATGMTGPFNGEFDFNITSSGTGNIIYTQLFDASRIVPTGPQNSPVAFSIVLWRLLPEVLP